LKLRGKLAPGLSHHFGEIGTPTLVTGLLILPFFVYVLTYWPLCQSVGVPFSIAQVKAMNVFIWDFHRNTTVGAVALSTPWYSWVLRLTPERGLSYLMGNFVIMSGGLVSVIFLFAHVRRLEFPEWAAVALYLANLLLWAVAPRHFTYYYYYYPAATFLCVVLVAGLKRAPRSIAGVRLTVITVFAASIFFLYCLPKMANLGVPWDTMFGRWSLY
jgi:hypothetical protein